MTGYNVHTESLVNAGVQFKRIAIDYKRNVPTGGLEEVSAGDGQIDEILHNTIKMLTLLHGMVGDATWQHGEKLELVAEKYQNAEHASMSRLFQYAVRAITTSGDLPNF